MKKGKQSNQNYLEKIPAPHPAINWSTDAKGTVTLEIENTGWANRLAQKLFKRPKVSFVHLDEMGSFIWPLMDGKQTIQQLGPSVEEQFGEKAQPLYPRLVKYFQILDSYHFIVWKE
jgi:hypothetical protein